MPCRNDIITDMMPECDNAKLAQAVGHVLSHSTVRSTLFSHSQACTPSKAEMQTPAHGRASLLDAIIYNDEHKEPLQAVAVHPHKVVLAQRRFGRGRDLSLGNKNGT